jgi:hypothetical protein
MERAQSQSKPAIVTGICSSFCLRHSTTTTPKYQCKLPFSFPSDTLFPYAVRSPIHQATVISQLKRKHMKLQILKGL